MNLSVHHVSNNFDNGWGFYIDLESLKPVLPGDKYYLEPIYEEPHFIADDYYDNDVYDNDVYDNDIYDDDVYDNDVYSFYDKDAISKIDEFGAYIVRVGSTTIITAIITYALLFIL
jgi:hypothetical protein